MVDPNRKINLATVVGDDDSDSDLNDEHIAMIKKYEDEFKHRFTDEDIEFSDFCKEKMKPPPIVYPYERNENRRGGGRGGGGRGGRFNNHHGRNNNYNNYDRSRNVRNGNHPYAHDDNRHGHERNNQQWDRGDSNRGREPSTYHPSRESHQEHR
ncbi:unnamed protein product [Diamesa serratosioi]